jgi:hypothetical protein
MKNLNSSNLFNNVQQLVLLFNIRTTQKFAVSLKQLKIPMSREVACSHYRISSSSSIQSDLCSNVQRRYNKMAYNWIFVSQDAKALHLLRCFFLAFHVYFPRILVHSSNFINVQSQPAGFEPALTEGFCFQLRRRSATTAIFHPSYIC